MQSSRRYGALAAGMLMMALGTAQAGTVRTDGDSEYRPTGKGWGELADSPGVVGHAKSGGAAGRAGNGISYHGGPLLTNGVHVYYIWYGSWAGNSATTILPTLASAIGGSPYFNINSTYYDGAGIHVANTVSYAGSATVAYPYGTSLSDQQIQQVVADAVGSKVLPNDTNGVYFVLTSADVNASSGFCTQYCGWHTKGTIAGSTLQYSFIGNPDRCPTSCNWQPGIGPNGNPGADGMASIIAHELEEATTDPHLNAWFDVRGYENADKCAWTFGTTYTTSNGAMANMNLGGLDFLIQRNWVNAKGGYCDTKYP